MSQPPSPPRIAVVAFDRISPFHLSVPALVFGEDRRELGAPRFPFRVCSIESGPLRTTAGFVVQADAGLGALRQADVVIVPSWRDPDEPAPPALLRALRAAHRRGAVVVGLCLGAFVLAEAGLLDGRPATTHWHWAETFGRRFPSVALDPDVLYIDDGNILTSAGTAASLDCCLHLLRRYCSASIANRVARRLVVAPHRDGGQAQFVEQPLPASASDSRLSALLAWLESHLDKSHALDDLAARAAMSRRSFTRHFQRATGRSLVDWLVERRVARACDWLETSHMPVETIAERLGFGTAASLRQHFHARRGLSPAEYRRRFRAGTD